MGVLLIGYVIFRASTVPTTTATLPTVSACVSAPHHATGGRPLSVLERPSHFLLSCTAGGTELTEISWSTWNTSHATGLAHWHYLGCGAVACFPGRVFPATFDVRVALSSPTDVGHRFSELRLEALPGTAPCISTPATRWRLTLRGPVPLGGSLGGVCL